MLRLVQKLFRILPVKPVSSVSVQVFRQASNQSVAKFSIPFTRYALVSNSQRLVMDQVLSEAPDGELTRAPTADELAGKPCLNWRPDLDEERILGTAVVHRAEISGNQYTDAYRNKAAARIASKNGRVYWRLETIAQLRRSRPDIFRGKVLEVGAGTSVASSRLSTFDEVEEVHALDYDPYTVEKLMPRVQWSMDADRGKITRVVGSYNRLECPDGHYDALVAVGAMHHSEDLNATLSECYRVLKPGGFLVVIDYCLSADLTQQEGFVMSHLPHSEDDAKQIESGASYDQFMTHRDISEHPRPIFDYQSSAFHAGFNVETFIFDATTNHGGWFARFVRKLSISLSRKKYFSRSSCPTRSVGYDEFGNVDTLGLGTRVLYPQYAKGAAGIWSYLAKFGRGEAPIYDNMVLLLEKPELSDIAIAVRFASGAVYQLPATKKRL